MGKYGLKIRNYEAGSIYEYDLGLRDYYDYQDAMLTNSLFLDYLYEIGIETIKDKATRDVICVEFSYGTRTYDEHMKKLKSMLEIETKKENQDKEKTLLQIMADRLMKSYHLDKKSVVALIQHDLTQIKARGTSIDQYLCDEKKSLDEKLTLFFEQMKSGQEFSSTFLFSELVEIYMIALTLERYYIARVQRLEKKQLLNQQEQQAIVKKNTEDFSRELDRLTELKVTYKSWIEQTKQERVLIQFYSALAKLLFRQIKDRLSYQNNGDFKVRWVIASETELSDQLRSRNISQFFQFYQDESVPTYDHDIAIIQNCSSDHKVLQKK